MKKMAFLLAMILVVAVSVAPAYAAEDATSVPMVAPVAGKFTVEQTGLTAGEWYGMLVLEKGVAPSATLDSSDILYIDQVKADANGKIEFKEFGLLGGALEGDVYIGGAGLNSAKNIAELGTPVLTGITLDKTAAEAQAGKTVDLTATFVPAGATGEITWSSSSDTVAEVAKDPTDQTKATVTVAGGVAAGTTVTITAAVGEFKAECVITIVEAPAFILGDVNGDTTVNGQDAQRLYEHLNGSNVIPAGDTKLLAANVNGDATVNGQDAQRLYEHLNGSNPLK